MIKLLFFARLRDQLQCEELQLELNTNNSNESFTQTSLINYLCEQNPEWSPHLKNSSILVAINQEIVHCETEINPNDEIAFFPPVTGG